MPDYTIPVLRSSALDSAEMRHTFILAEGSSWIRENMLLPLTNAWGVQLYFSDLLNMVVVSTGRRKLPTLHRLVGRVLSVSEPFDVRELRTKDVKEVGFDLHTKMLSTWAEAYDSELTHRAGIYIDMLRRDPARYRAKKVHFEMYKED